MVLAGNGKLPAVPARHPPHGTAAVGFLRAPGPRLCVLAALGLTACATPAPEDGVVVAAAAPWGAAARAGVAPADVIIGWRRAGEVAGAARPVESPLDLIWVESDEGARGPIALDLQSGRTRREALLQTGEWGLSVTPVVPRGHAAALREAMRLAEGSAPEAAEAWEGLATAAAERGRSTLAAWCWSQGGLAALRGRDADAAREAFRRARTLTVEPHRVAVLWELEGVAFIAVGDGLAARRAHEEALIIRRRLDPASPAVARSLAHLANSDYTRQDRGGVDPAEKAVELYRTHPAARLETAWALRILANFAFVLGRIDRAEELYQEALTLRRPLAPEGSEVNLLNENLGLIAHDRGFLDEAERRYRESLAVALRSGSDGEGVAHSSNYLGIVAKDKGSYEEARRHYERALGIFRRLRPDGLEVAGCVNNLGNLAQLQGDLVAAERFHREALDRRRATSPDSVDTAASLHNVGRLARELGRYAEAEELLQSALALKQRLGVGTLLEASTLFELGETARATGALDRAEALHTRALSLRHGVAPGSGGEAASLFALGAVAHDRGRLSHAEGFWRRGIAVLEGKRQQLRFSSDDKSRFVAPFHAFYRRLAILLSETGRPQEAFGLLESARARALRIMMEQRGTPRVREATPELAAERYRLEAELGRRESQLERVNFAVEAEAAAGILQEIRRLEGQLDGVDARIRAAVPLLAGLDDPPPLPPQELATVFGEGDLLLAFAVDDEETLLFTLGGGAEPALRAHSLPVGAAELERRVSVLRALIARGRHGAAVEPALVVQARQLFDLLLAPATEELEAARQLLIVADGPLLPLPFGALVRSVDPLEYLATWKPLALAQSAAVFAELRRRRGPRADRAAVVAFGDPDQDEAHGLARLPHSRREVERIAALFGARATVFLGAAATESRVKSTVGTGGFVHFAAHALLNRRFPLDSALVLARRDEGEDGLLHAWEIAEMQLDADLVTLSACNSALGGELAGEGVLGLARAFQYAGARSLLVSLWPVSDRSTAELMRLFYSRLQDGEGKSEALRAAQTELVEAGAAESSHPFHWAAFQLIGDWD
jgi:CHAT domain-containing protein/tetratricopeptide (TPR) repeat protein